MKKSCQIPKTLLSLILLLSFLVVSAHAAAPDSIEVKLTGGDAAGNFALPATLKAKSFAGPSTTFTGSNGKLERGTPLYSREVEAGATFYAVSGGVLGFPSPTASIRPYPNRLGGSSFIAIKEDSEGNKKIWVNLSSGAWKTNASSGTTMDWEYQFRYFIDTKTGEEKASLGTVPNAGGYAGQAVEFTVKIFFKSTLVIDPNPSLVDDDGRLKNDINTIASMTAPPKVSGAATDGVTRLLLVTETKDKEEIKFFLPSTKSGSFGTLAQPDQNKSEITIPSVKATVDGKEKWVAIAVYTAPDSYGYLYSLKEERKAIISIFRGSSLDKEEVAFRLYTPPVVLVHGMWSGPDAWLGQGKGVEVLQQAGFGTVKTADYSSWSHHTFDPTNLESSLPRAAVRIAIEEALTDYRNKKIATTQVDVVAHSLGGLMTRSLIQQPTYLSKKNFKKGYVHKLITIGTPHQGSPFGPLLWEKTERKVKMHAKNGEQIVYSSIPYFFDLAGQPVGTVHRDFDPNSEAFKKLYSENKFKAHAITSSFRPDAETSQNALSVALLTVWGKTHDEVFTGENKDANGKAIVDDSDVIVKVSSQKGGLVADAVSPLFPSTTHSPMVTKVNRLSQTSSKAILLTVIDLLTSNEEKRFSDGFPKFEGDKKGGNSGSDAPVTESTTAAVLASQGEMGILNPEARIKIASPVRGAKYQHDSTTTISLTMEMEGGAVPQSAFFMVEGMGYYPVSSKTPYTATVKLSPETPIGRLNVIAVARDITDILLGDTTSIYVVPKSPVAGLEVSPRSISLDADLVESSLFVSGTFTSNNQVITANISSSATGTTYKAQKGNSVISVSNDGLVTAVAVGSDVIEVKNGNQVVLVPVEVSSVCKMPAQPGSISGKETVCLGTESYSIPSVAGVKYQWDLSTTNAVLTQTGNSATVKWERPGTYTLTVKPYSGGCIGTTRTISVTVESVPSKPTVTASGASLTSSSPTGNQWFRNGTAIAGATGQSFTATANGTYTVQVSGTCGKSELSEAVVMNLTSVANEMEESIRVFPNPAHERLFVELPQGLQWQRIQLLSTHGKTVKSLNRNGNAAGVDPIEVSTLTRGLYILQIATDKGTVRRKVVLQ